jgi:two-component system osmolarity sensor histidine kinase EnvZ
MRLPRPWPRVFWRLVKRLTPTSLFGRSLLIIVLPVAVMQIAVTYVFFDAHWQEVNSHLTEGLAGDVSLITARYEQDPSPANLARIQAEAQENLALSIVAAHPCSSPSIALSPAPWPNVWTSPSGSTPTATRPMWTSG